MRATYRVDGMTCGGCAASVTRVVEAIAPGITVEVSLEQKTITVAGDADEEAVGRAVRAAGFTFGGRIPGDR